MSTFSFENRVRIKNRTCYAVILRARMEAWSNCQFLPDGSATGTLTCHRLVSSLVSCAIKLNPYLADWITTGILFCKKKSEEPYLYVITI